MVLASCGTGLGHIAGSQRRRGASLQLAFQLAGAKNVVASMWKVGYRATVADVLFYHKLWVERKPAAVAVQRSPRLAVLCHPEQIESLATTRGPNFKTVKVGGLLPTYADVPNRPAPTMGGICDVGARNVVGSIKEAIDPVCEMRLEYRPRAFIPSLQKSGRARFP